MFQILINAVRETLFMVMSASTLAIVVGIPLGVFIAGIAASRNKPLKSIYYLLAGIMDLAKSVPFLMIMLMFIPMTNWFISHSIPYTSATILPLAVAGTLLLAHKVYTIVHEHALQWRATGKAMGATPQQTLWLILLPESSGEIITASTNVTSILLGFSTIAGALGAGGLGQLAIEKSIEQPNMLYVMLSILILVVLQHVIQYTGAKVVQHTQPR